MFRKLLKYDMRALLKYWWVAAAASIILSVIGGFCIQITRVEYTEYNFLMTAATIGIILIVMALVAFYIVNNILIYVRFYKNFFTDEGYLTFTLPVKRSDLLGSKLLSSTVFSVFTLVALGLDAAVMISIGFVDVIFTKQTLADISRWIKEVATVLGGYLAVYIIEFIVGAIALIAFSILIVFACITISSALTKKHKIITAIGVYYAYSAVVSTIMQIFMLDMGFLTIFERIAELPPKTNQMLLAIVALGVIGLVVLVSAALYILEEYLLRRRLNLD